MSSTLYLECYSGISGDMTVAALLDLGADKNILKRALKSLNIDGFEIEISKVKKAGIDACDFNVILDKKHENYDHNMSYLKGEEYELNLGESDIEDNFNINNGEKNANINYIKEHIYSYKKNCEYENRGLSEILDIINNSKITIKAKELAKRIFKIIAEAEAKAHGIKIDEVHFHEVGAVDSIVDIVSVAVCIDNLGIEKVITSELYEGCGFVRCQHGMIPIPVPAVTQIVSDNDLSLHITSMEGELITPTGAAIVAALRNLDKLPQKFSIEKIGVGSGKRNYDRPSILRAMLIKDKTSEEDYIYKLESNIDDCSGETFAFVMERLFEAGARDVHYMPIYMKKNRPAYQLNVICKAEYIEKLEEIIFEETTTIGIRRIKMERSILKREIKNIQTSLGEAQVKICTLESGSRVYPEYSSVVELCKKNKMSYQDVYNLIKKEY